MAIKFYRAKALPSSLNSSHDGVWFIKPDGATSFRTYNVKDGVAVGDGFEDLEIGGRNYVLKSDEEREIIYYSGNYHLTEPIIAGQEYTVSAMINGDSSVNNRFMIYLSGPGISNTYIARSEPAISVFNEFTLVKITFTAPQSVDGAVIARLYFGNSSDTITYKIKNVKLEKGNVATDWTPAPEDKEDAFEKNTAFNKDFGTSAGTVAEGNDVRLSNSREWTASTVSQSEAQAGTSTTRRAWSALRVRQAITAWWNTIVDTIAEKTWVSANFDKYGFWNLKTNGIQRKTIQSGNDVDFVAGNNMKVGYGAGGVVTFSAQDTPLNDAILAGNEISHEAIIDIVNNNQFIIQRNTNDGQSNINLGGDGSSFAIGFNIGQTGDGRSSIIARKSDVSIRNTGGYGVGISTNIGGAVYHAYLKTDNITGNRTVQFPNKSGTIALEEDIDTKIDEYFETNPAAENLTYPLVIVDHVVCKNIINNARYLYTGDAKSVCLAIDGGVDEGKEILILNDTGSTLQISSSNSPMRKLHTVLGGLVFPAGYKGRFRVINGELVEIG